MIYCLEIINPKDKSRTGLYISRSRFKRMIRYTYFLRMGFAPSRIKMYEVKYDMKGVAKVEIK